MLSPSSRFARIQKKITRSSRSSRSHQALHTHTHKRSRRSHRHSGTATTLGTAPRVPHDSIAPAASHGRAQHDMRTPCTPSFAQAAIRSVHTHAQSLFTRMPNRSIHTLPCTHRTRNTSALGPRQAHEITAAFTAAQTAQAAPHRAPPRAPPHAVPSQGREVGQAGQACQQGGGWQRAGAGAVQRQTGHPARQ